MLAQFLLYSLSLGARAARRGDDAVKRIATTNEYRFRNVQPTAADYAQVRSEASAAGVNADDVFRQIGIQNRDPQSFSRGSSSVDRRKDTINESSLDSSKRVQKFTAGGKKVSDTQRVKVNGDFVAPSKILSGERYVPPEQRERAKSEARKIFETQIKEPEVDMIDFGEGQKLRTKEEGIKLGLAPPPSDPFRQELQATRRRIGEPPEESRPFELGGGGAVSESVFEAEPRGTVIKQAGLFSTDFFKEKSEAAIQRKESARVEMKEADNVFKKALAGAKFGLATAEEFTLGGEIGIREKIRDRPGTLALEVGITAAFPLLSTPAKKIGSLGLKAGTKFVPKVVPVISSLVSKIPSKTIPTLLMAGFAGTKGYQLGQARFEDQPVTEYGKIVSGTGLELIAFSAGSKVGTSISHKIAERIATKKYLPMIKQTSDILKPTARAKAIKKAGKLLVVEQPLESATFTELNLKTPAGSLRVSRFEPRFGTESRIRPLSDVLKEQFLIKARVSQEVGVFAKTGKLQAGVRTPKGEDGSLIFSKKFAGILSRPKTNIEVSKNTIFKPATQKLLGTSSRMKQRLTPQKFPKTTKTGVPTTTDMFGFKGRKINIDFEDFTFPASRLVTAKPAPVKPKAALSYRIPFTEITPSGEVFKGVVFPKSASGGVAFFKTKVSSTKLKPFSKPKIKPTIKVNTKTTQFSVDTNARQRLVSLQKVEGITKRPTAKQLKDFPLVEAQGQESIPPSFKIKSKVFVPTRIINPTISPKPIITPFISRPSKKFKRSTIKQEPTIDITPIIIPDVKKTPKEIIPDTYTSPDIIKIPDIIKTPTKDRIPKKDTAYDTPTIPDDTPIIPPSFIPDVISTPDIPTPTPPPTYTPDTTSITPAGFLPLASAFLSGDTNKRGKGKSKSEFAFTPDFEASVLNQFGAAPKKRIFTGQERRLKQKGKGFITKLPKEKKKGMSGLLGLFSNFNIRGI